MMWNFSNSIILPHDYNQQRPGWKDNEVLRYVPPIMLADVGEKGIAMVKAAVASLASSLPAKKKKAGKKGKGKK